MTKQPEGKVSAKIKNAMIARGAYVWKVHGNEYTPTGLPDLVGSYRGYFVGVETKMIDGHGLSRIQIYRIRRLQAAGAFVAAPCLTVARALEMLDAIDEWISLAAPGEPTYELEHGFGKFWDPDAHT